jgi:hypothetical protein
MPERDVNVRYFATVLSNYGGIRMMNWWLVVGVARGTSTPIDPDVVKWEEWQGQRVACLCHTLKLSARTFADSIVGDPACLRMKATVQFFPMVAISRSLFKYRAAS